MKEIKEVVHVPTRELAEEVLRVAKENGFKMPRFELEHYLKTSGEELCFGFDEAYFSFANKGFYKEEEGYTIITAEEFLNRYKPKFRPIAMRCNQEQFDAVKGKLVGCCLVGVSNFTENIYLVNNYLGHNSNIGNVIFSTIYDRQVFEEWNEKTFLECCGIEVNDEVNELEQLRKENAELKQQLKELQDQPKVGDVCLFWDGVNKYALISKLSSNGGIEGVGKYDHCIKATDENIKAKIKELENE